MSGWNSSHSRSGWSTRAGDAWAAEPWLLKLTDAGLLSVLILAPFLMAGRQAPGQMALCAATALTALCWCLHQARRGDGRWRWTGIEPILLLGIGLIVLQCCNLSPELLTALSPKTLALLPEWTGSPDSAVGGAWSKISFTPAQTVSNLTVIVACVLFFFTAVQRLQTLEDVQRFLAGIAVAGVLMALFGLVQFVFGNGKFFWVYDHPMTDTRHVAKGAFTNANHFANFLGMTIPAQLGLLVQRLSGGERSSRRSARGRWGGSSGPDFIALALALGIVATGLAILLSMSRGGIVCALGGTALVLLIYGRKSLLSARLTVGILLLALLALAGTIVFGDAASRMIEQNIAELTSNDLEQLDRGDSRRKIWAADLEGVREFPLVGSGLGSHSETYWLWYNHPGDGKEYSHAENGPLQIALETGLTGLGLAGLLWLIVLLWCAQGLWNVTTPRGVAAATAAAAGLLMNLAHSAVDFVWYVPACMNLALMYAVIAWRTSLMRFSESQRGDAVPAAGAFSLPRLAWLAAVPAVLALGAWMVQEKLPELAAEPVWQDYLRLTYAQQSAKGDEFSAAETLLQRRIKLALAAAQANPRAHRMQLHAGLACLRQFALNQQQAHSQMPLAQIRDAARTLFNSPDEMQAWLNRPGVLGAGRSLIEEAISHFRASLKECPLQPRPYLELAELTWLEGQSEAQERALIEQAVTARPYDGRAQFALGRMLWLAGAQREGIVHWQNSFRLDSSYRDQLIQSLAAYVPARFFLENFEPDHTALVQLRGAYRGSEDRAGYQAVVETLARSAVKEAVSADGLVAERNWLLAHECFDELADAKGAYHSAREAIAANPSSFPAHRALAIWLYKNGHYRESTEQLNWCRQRQPEAEWLTKLLQDALQRAEPSVPKAYAEGPSGVRR